jgi:hypothetical protein
MQALLGVEQLQQRKEQNASVFRQAAQAAPAAQAAQAAQAAYAI